MKRILIFIACLALALSLALPAAAAEFRLSVEELDKLASCMPDRIRDVVFLEGTWYDMGVQYARTLDETALRVRLERGIAARMRGGLTSEEAYAAMSDVHAAYEEQLPELLDLFRGIADGSGYSEEEVFLAMSNISGGCNSSAAWDEATGGEVYVAINSDTPGTAANYYDPSIILYPDDPAYPDDTLPVITWRGLLSNGILNASGVAYTLTAGQGAVEGDQAEVSVFPHYVALIYATRADSAEAGLADFTGYLDSTSYANPSIVMIADASGDGYVLEMTNTEYAVRRQNESFEGDRDYFIFNNMFLSEEMDDHNTYDGMWDDCPYRYATVQHFFERDYGQITPDTMREAMACQTYVDIDTGEMTEKPEYVNAPSSYFSPENVAANEKSAGRMIMDLNTLKTYILNGDEDPRLTIVPEGTGVYTSLTLCATPAEVTAEAGDQALLYMYQAIADLSDEEDAADREAHLNACKAAYFRGNNILCMLNGFTDPDEFRVACSMAVTAFMEAQAEAKLAWDDPNTIACDYDGAGYIF